MMRSTELCEMSRSCHRAMFSYAATMFAAHQAGQAADLLAGYRIALVRHRGTAALLAAERLFGFADFGALQMANFEGDLFERARRSAPARSGNARDDRAESLVTQRA